MVRRRLAAPRRGTAGRVHLMSSKDEDDEEAAKPYWVTQDGRPVYAFGKRSRDTSDGAGNKTDGQNSKEGTGTDDDARKPAATITPAENSSQRAARRSPVSDQRLDSLVATTAMTPRLQGSSDGTANGEGTQTTDRTPSSSTSTDVEVLQRRILELEGKLRETDQSPNLSKQLWKNKEDLEQQNTKLVAENQRLEKKLNQIHRKCERFRLRNEDLYAANVDLERSNRELTDKLAAHGDAPKSPPPTSILRNKKKFDVPPTPPPSAEVEEFKLRLDQAMRCSIQTQNLYAEKMEQMKKEHDTETTVLKDQIAAKTEEVERLQQEIDSLRGKKDERSDSKATAESPSTSSRTNSPSPRGKKSPPQRKHQNDVERSNGDSGRETSPRRSNKKRARRMLDETEETASAKKKPKWLQDLERSNAVFDVDGAETRTRAPSNNSPLRDKSPPRRHKSAPKNDDSTEEEEDYSVYDDDSTEGGPDGDSSEVATQVETPGSEFSNVSSEGQSPIHDNDSSDKLTPRKTLTWADSLVTTEAWPEKGGRRLSPTNTARKRVVAARGRRRPHQSLEFYSPS